MAGDPFAPPPEDKKPLELETEWAHEKASKQATATVHEPPATRSKAWIGIAIGLVVAGVIAAGVVIQLRSAKHHDDHGKLPATANTVVIEIRANPAAFIRIDGHKAGKTPLTVHVPKSTTPVEISNGRKAQTVIPDHDQLIDFTR